MVIPVYRPDQKLNQLLSMLARQKRRPEKVVLMENLGKGVEMED